MANGEEELVQRLLTAVDDLTLTNQDREETLNKLIAQLECPVCMETCAPPIFMCRNSHIVCSSCQSKLTECPTCRAPGRPEMKNLFAEAASRQLGGPCENLANGCSSFVVHGNLSTEKHICLFNYDCGLCEYTCDITGLHNHIVANHPDRYSMSNEWQGFVITEDWEYHYFYYQGSLFICELFLSRKNNTLYLSALNLGPADMPGKYKCVFEFTSEDRVFKCSFQVPIGGIYDTNHCIKFVDVESLKMKDGGLRCKMTIELAEV